MCVVCDLVREIEEIVWGGQCHTLYQRGKTFYFVSDLILVINTALESSSAYSDLNDRMKSS